MTVALGIDIAFIVIIIVCAIIGLVRGFAKTAVSMVGVVASVFLAILASKPLASLIDKIFKASTFFGDKISQGFIKLNELYFGTTLEVAKSGADIAAEIGSVEGVSFPIKAIIKTALKNQNVLEGETIGGVLGSIFGNLVTIAIAVVVAFILIRLILFIITKIFDKLLTFSMFGAVDKVLGFVLGGIKGLIYIGCAFAIVSLLSFMPTVNSYVNGITEDSKVAGGAYKYVDEWTQDYVADNLQNIVDKIRAGNE